MPSLTVLVALWAAPAVAQQPAPAPAPEATTVSAPRGAPAGEPVPAAPTDPVPAATPADPELTLDQVLTTPEDELRAQLAAQAEQLAAQQRAIEDLQTDLSETKLEMIPDPAIQVEWEGHYRVRGHVFNHLYASQDRAAKDGGYRDARYMTHRLWLRPVFNYQDLAKLKVELHALDDVVWGDNISEASTALFAETPGTTDLEGQTAIPIEVGRLWMDITIPVGLLRVGRQPTEWGMGILAQSGERHDKKFGTNHYASTNDRVFFATRPLAIYQKIAGKKDTNTPFYLGVAVDRLVEDPLIQYDGFQCELGVAQGDPDYDPRCDEDGDGVSDRDHGYTTDRTPDQRQPDWWADQDDDVWQMVYVAVYRGEDIDYLGGHGDLTAGTWIVNRFQPETESKVLIVDGHVKADVHGVILQAEGIRIVGDTRAITLPGSVDPTNPDPLAKRANIWGYAAEAGYHQPAWKLLFEHGYASGDDVATDKDFTGRALNPDHNVGLLLYEEVLARVTATNWTSEARGLWSRGGVYNSRYIFPTAHLYPLDNWEVLAGFVTAWPDKPDGVNIRCSSGDARIDECSSPSSLQATAATIGWEVDAGIKHTWHEHVDLAIEGGYAETTDRINTEGAGLNPEGKFFTFQTQLQYRF